MDLFKVKLAKEEWRVEVQAGEPKLPIIVSS
jgi:hypothetical protein